MPTIAVKTPSGGSAGTLELDAGMFGVQPNVPVMHQVVTAQLAAARRGTQSTKTRAEVSGGGAKPFRQKGTGRARQGSTRAPHWSGGGIALGPKPRSYRQRTPKKMIRLALASALSDRFNEERVVIVDSWAFDAPSTKAAVEVLDALGVSDRVLLVVHPERDDTAIKSFRNLPKVQLIFAGELNAYDILCNEWVVFSKAVVPGQRSDEITIDAVIDAGVAELAAAAPAEVAAAADEPADAPSDEEASE